MDRKAQASTEYLVILAVVIVVAVVVAGLMGGFISFGGETSDKQSKIYWSGTADIQLLEWVMRADGADQLVVRNNKNFDLYLTNITVGSSTQSVNTTLAVGERKTVSADWSSCDKGASYSYQVSFLYDNVEFSIPALTFTGEKKILGTCQ